MHNTTLDLNGWIARMRQKFAISRAHAMDSGNYHHEHGISVLGSQDMPKDIQWARIDRIFEEDYKQHNAVYRDSTDYAPYDVFSIYSQEELDALRASWIMEEQRSRQNR